MKQLVQSLGHDDPALRAAAFFEALDLFTEWTEADLEWMGQAARSADPEVAALAGRALPRIRLRRSVADSLIHEHPSIAADIRSASGRRAFRLLEDVIQSWTHGRIEASAVSLLCELSVLEGWFSEMEGIEILARFDELKARPCLPLIVRYCGSEDMGTATCAAQVAASLGLPEALAPICTALERFDAKPGRQDEVDLVESAAILGVSKRPDMMKALIQNGSAPARRSAATIIRIQFAGEYSVDLLRMVEDQDHEVREESRRAMWTLGRPEFVEPLVKSLAAGEGVGIPDMQPYNGQFEASALAVELESTDPFRRRCAVWMIQWARGSREWIDRAMRDPDEGVRWSAAQTAGESGDPEHRQALLALLDDDSARVRQYAARALGLLGSGDAAPILRARLKSSPAAEQPDLLWSLAVIGDEPGVLDFVDKSSMGERDEEALSTICAALALTGGEPALSRLRSFDEAKIKESSLFQLSKSGEPTDAAVLSKAYFGSQHPTSGRELEEFDSLGAMPPNLLGLLRSLVSSERQAAARCCRLLTAEQLGDDILRELKLLHAQGDQRVGTAAGIALIALGKTTAVEEKGILNAVRALDDPYDDLKSAVALCEALARAHESEAWANYVREGKVPEDIRSPEAALALVRSRGLTADLSLTKSFVGRIAAGHIMSVRRLANRFGQRCMVLEGATLRMTNAPEALRYWADRLNR